MTTPTPLKVDDEMLAGILAEADSTVPYYVPHLVAEVRRLRQILGRVDVRLEAGSLGIPDARRLIAEGMR